MTTPLFAQRRPYEAPELIRVHVDPVKELLLQTNCNPSPGTDSNGIPLCQPPVCNAPPGDG
jgi:hypothetical protein